MKVHELKIDLEFYEAVASGDKNFEIRNNDRNFHGGDKLVLKAYKDGEYLDKPPLTRIVTYITDYHQAEGWVVMGMRMLNLFELILESEMNVLVKN